MWKIVFFFSDPFRILFILSSQERERRINHRNRKSRMDVESCYFFFRLRPIPNLVYHCPTPLAPNKISTFLSYSWNMIFFLFHSWYFVSCIHSSQREKEASPFLVFVTPSPSFHQEIRLHLKKRVAENPIYLPHLLSTCHFRTPNRLNTMKYGVRRITFFSFVLFSTCTYRSILLDEKGRSRAWKLWNQFSLEEEISKNYGLRIAISSFVISFLCPT